MGIDSGLYNTLLVLHILFAIAGFGGVMLNGLYGMQAKARKGREGLAVMESTMKVTEVSQKFIYGVFVLGILLMVVSDGSWKFDQLWLTLSVLLYAVAMGLSHGVMKKNTTRMRDLMAELADGPPPAGGPPLQAAELAQRGKAVGITGGILNLIIVAILALMVWKPL